MEIYPLEKINIADAICDYNKIYKCPKCVAFSYEDIVVDKIEYQIMELKRKCKDCSQIYGYWLTGNWSWYDEPR